MFYSKISLKRCIGALVLSSSLIAGLPGVSLAQSNSGFTLWSGIERENILNYYLDFGGVPNQWDRYRLRIGAKKMAQGASKFIITYPDYYDGKFDVKDIEVNYGISKYDKSAKIANIAWNEKERRLEIELEQPIEPKNKVEIKLSNVKNPFSGGTYYFNCQVMPLQGPPVPVYLGTWILSINR